MKRTLVARAKSIERIEEKKQEEQLDPFDMYMIATAGLGLYLLYRDGKLQKILDDVRKKKNKKQKIT